MNSLRKIGNVVTIIFVAIALVSVGAILSDLAYISYVRSIIAGGFEDEAKANRIDAYTAWIGISHIILLILGMIVFMHWFFHSHRNLVVNDLAGLRYSSPWAIIGFFVPVLNLFIPYRVMKEVWHGSAALYNQRMGVQVAVPRSSSLVGWWWACFLLTGFLPNISWRLFDLAESPSQTLFATWLLFASDLVEILAAIIALILVRRISELQDEVLNRLLLVEQSGSGQVAAVRDVPPTT